MLTKDEIISRTNKGLDVFKYFIKGEWRVGRNFLNPFYDDQKASCTIYFDKYKNIYKLKDFGNPDYSGDCFAIVGLIYKKDCRNANDFVDILKIINEGLHLGLSDEFTKSTVFKSTPMPTQIAQTTPEVKRNNYSFTKQQFTSKDLIFWQQYGIDHHLLVRYHVVSVVEFCGISKENKPYSIVGTVHELMFGYLGKQHIKLYRPFSTLRFMYGGSIDRYCFGLEQLPVKGDILFITAGEKDVLSLVARGFSAICFNSETVTIPKPIIKKLTHRFKHLVLLYDCDKTGLEASLKQQELLKEYDVKRLVLPADRLEKEMGRDNIDDFIEMFSLEGLGYNDFVIRHRKTLKTICQNDKTFDVDFHSYLKAFDGETRYLLGVDKGTEEEKFLDISGIAGQLKKKRILFDSVKAWSEIDLTPFNNSEITTLEEHIKRKWADISAETAGEQYTPDDIICLISEIIATKIEDNGKFLTIYDPTCGGGNLLFGVEDKIQDSHPSRPTATYGQEWNGTLYALAKIESRFRKDTEIEYGNTLTDIGKFWDKSFNVVVANPPYGVDWKGYEKDIKNDTTERFVALPSISDGQFLFTQHILHKLADDGFSIVVHNGSTLFSGDAGSGESNIRKHFFDKDWVEAIVQMPTDEFFNTGIYTYLWIFNKNKPADRKNKVILINGSELSVPLKKSKGKKRKEMDLPNRTKIVQALTGFKDNDFAKVFDKWHFYYNKQSILLANIDENGKAIEMPIKTAKDGDHKEEKSIKLTPVKIAQITDDSNLEITDFDITTFDTAQYSNLEQYFEEGIKPLLAELDYKEKHLLVSTKDANYYYHADIETIVEQTSKGKAELGCGKIVIKASLKKDSKTKKVKSISITADLTPDLQKDYEIVPYNPIEVINQKCIVDFMEKYITKPFDYIDNVIGVEINFNKVFYTPEKLRDVKDIRANLEALEKELANLENDLAI